MEVEELAEEVLADKRQVGGVSTGLGLGFCGWACELLGQRAGSGIRLQLGLAVN